MMYRIKIISMLVVGMLFTGCFGIVAKSENFPQVAEKSMAPSIMVFELKNYTDTPQAGKRAANIMEGVLTVKGYRVIDAIDVAVESLADQIAKAKEAGADYVLTGGISEWRYKTGIDGEPAVSLTCKLIDVSTSQAVWSATGSDNSWGHDSIGTTAQTLIDSML